MSGAGARGGNGGQRQPAAAFAFVAALTTVASLLALAAPAAPASAQAPDEGPQLTVLLHHPDDGVDPLGFEYALGQDYFQWRYAPIVADKQRFDYPFFVADGVLPIEGPVDPDRPYIAALGAYTQALDERLTQATPATLRLASTHAGGRAAVTVAVDPVAPVTGEDVHLMVAVTEDPVHYQPPPKLTNGIVDHRFTVRAVQDLGRVDLAAPSTWTANVTLDDGWQRDRLHIAAWLQQGTGSARFPAREVLQATNAPLGDSVTQAGKGVLLEMYSAIWCLPCYHGDRAIEDLAIERAAAEPLAAASGARYFVAPSAPVLVAAAALAVGAATAWWGGGRR